MKRTIIAAWIVILALAAPAVAGHLHPERWYQEAWCQDRGGVMEVVLADGTRCDCITKSHAVEVDFARKWAEGIGQSLHYARLTGQRAGLLLIMERPKDWAYVRRVEQLRNWLGLPLDVWTVGP